MTLPRFLAPARRHARSLLLAALATLAACGGSVSRVEVFAPTAFVSFGDELSYLESDGRKYSINIFATVTNADGTVSNTTSFNCAAAPVWNQSLAASFNFAFGACNPGLAGVRTADLRSAPGATVAQVAAQVAAYRSEAGKGFTPRTLVTVMAGLHDVLDAYEVYRTGGPTEAKRLAAMAVVTAAGKQLGDLVNAIADNGRGGRVIYSSIPDLQYSPLAVAHEAAAPGSLLMLRDLSAAFNTSFRITVLDDGRYAGVVLGDELMQILGKFGGFALPAVSPCTKALPDCSPSTLTDVVTNADGTKTDGTATAHLWADATRPGITWHSRVASLAESRARNNPF
jgi:hypothetical protein